MKDIRTFTTRAEHGLTDEALQAHAAINARLPPYREHHYRHWFYQIVTEER